MDKIIMLGVGNGGTLDLYNTCFAIQHDNDNFLVDTGGSIEIIKKSLQHGNLYKMILFCDVLIIIYFLAHISYMGQRP